jgi:beta-glucanase (GH16 family)
LSNEGHLDVKSSGGGDVHSRVMNLNCIVFFSLALVAARLNAAEPTAALPSNPTDTLPALTNGQRWELVFQDEFNSAQIDTNKWEIMGDARRRDDWWLKENSFLDGKGNLVIRTKQTPERRSSGCVRTKGKFEHAFGYWVARMQLQKQPGHWTAFWLMSDKVFKVGNAGRDGTEIDICEFPYLDGRYEINLHWDGYGREHRNAGQKIKAPGITEGFHTFALWWTPTEYIFYCDGKEQWRTSAGGVCQQPLYAKFSVEIGTWAGDLKQAKLPDQFLVDYVRVYDAVGTTNPPAKRD